MKVLLDDPMWARIIPFVSVLANNGMSDLKVQAPGQAKQLDP